MGSKHNAKLVTYTRKWNEIMSMSKSRSRTCQRLCTSTFWGFRENVEVYSPYYSKLKRLDSEKGKWPLLADEKYQIITHVALLLLSPKFGRSEGPERGLLAQNNTREIHLIRLIHRRSGTAWFYHGVIFTWAFYINRRRLGSFIWVCWPVAKQLWW